VTIVRRGTIDHSDSLGAAARFGSGDVQWLTAGQGIVHSEMFPLLDPARPNPLELFQIWLNLPSVDKLVAPHFAMLWSDAVPKHVVVDEAGRRTVVTVIAGQLAGDRAPPPPPRSWAARTDTDVAIWSIHMEPRAACALPPAASPMTTRTLYFFRGPSLKVSGSPVDAHAAVLVQADRALYLEAGDGACEILLLQGRPIGERVAQHGPFVMNTREEIQRAFDDYRRTRFGGWPWPTDDPVHPRTEGRFARHADGRLERTGS
jgi:redox-sensitive bicupin YhaK (pirin superfamily)